jgi:hypothetical protein
MTVMMIMVLMMMVMVMMVTVMMVMMVMVMMMIMEMVMIRTVMRTMTMMDGSTSGRTSEGANQGTEIHKAGYSTHTQARAIPRQLWKGDILI